MDELEFRRGEVESPLLTGKEVREMLNISDSQLEYARNHGKIRYVSLPGIKRYFRREVERYGKTLKARRD